MSVILMIYWNRYKYICSRNSM